MGADYVEHLCYCVHCPFKPILKSNVNYHEEVDQSMVDFCHWDSTIDLGCWHDDGFEPLVLSDGCGLLVLDDECGPLVLDDGCGPLLLDDDGCEPLLIDDGSAPLGLDAGSGPLEPLGVGSGLVNRCLFSG